MRWVWGKTKQLLGLGMRWWSVFLHMTLCSNPHFLVNIFFSVLPKNDLLELAGCCTTQLFHY